MKERTISVLMTKQNIAKVKRLLKLEYVGDQGEFKSLDSKYRGSIFFPRTNVDRDRISFTFYKY